MTNNNRDLGISVGGTDGIFTTHYVVGSIALPAHVTTTAITLPDARYISASLSSYEVKLLPNKPLL